MRCTDLLFHRICCTFAFAAQSRQWACIQAPSPPHPAADYAAYVLLILSASCSLTHLAIGACVFVAATGRPARSVFRLLLSFEPLVGGWVPTCETMHSCILCAHANTHMPALFGPLVGAGMVTLCGAVCWAHPPLRQDAHANMPGSAQPSLLRPSLLQVHCLE